MFLANDLFLISKINRGLEKITSHKLTFNPSTGDLYYQGEVFGMLNTTESRILVAMLNASPEVVEKERLLDIAWPNRNVTLNSLNVAIKKIREIFYPIFGDDVIITHFKKGFSWNDHYHVEIVSNKNITDNTPSHLVIEKETNLCVDTLKEKNIQKMHTEMSVPEKKNLELINP